MTQVTQERAWTGHVQRLLGFGLGLAVLMLGLARLRFAAIEPLWFDEAFTLAITSQPDWSSFWREVWLDSNGPVFYVLIRLWSGLFGTSNLALRIPSLLAVGAAGALVLATPLNGQGRGGRLTWAALIVAWWGVGYFLDARCYGLLLLASTGQCLAFTRLMDRPGGRRALVWAAGAAAAILVHYYAVFLGLAQGLIYLGRYRQRALRAWPAALAFVPAFAWVAHHAPRLADYSKLAAIWHPPIDALRAVALAGRRPGGLRDRRDQPADPAGRGGDPRRGAAGGALWTRRHGGR